MVAWKSFRTVPVGLVALGLAFSTASAQERMRVGENYAIHIDSHGSSDVEVGRTGTARVYEISHPGATYVAIHFSRFHLAAGDFLIVSDANGGQSYVLEGKGKMNAGTFWSQHVKGDTIVLELVSARDPPGLGFVIDEYVAGFVSLGPGIERICGVNDFENAICRAPSIEYDRAQSVARLLIQGAFLCTGWLASANNHFITNEHCISSATAALNTDYEFGAEAPNCPDFNCQLCHPGTIFSGASFIQDNVGLDYSLIQLAGNPSATFGFLQIDNRVAVVGEQIYLVSYPAGRAKEFAYNSSEDVGGLATVQSITEPTCTGATLEVGYWADTEGGSSGSPVLAVSSQKVIALHHCHNFCDQGGLPNRGVPIDQICAQVCGFFGSCGDGTCDPGEDQCNCAADCGTPPGSEAGLCTDTLDNDCDGPTDCDDSDCAGDPACQCGNGTCDPGEDCNSCPADCISGGGGCGDGICEGSGEDCFSCPGDCRCAGGGGCNHCCGDGSCSGSENANNCPVDCDPGFQPPQGFCCGDGNCETGEDSCNCAVDCGGTCPTCGDGNCDSPIEDQCNCAADCGNPPANETPNVDCQDGIDNDCDGGVDCQDTDNDCDTDPACACGGNGASCNGNGDCCSNKCRNGTCRGN